MQAFFHHSLSHEPLSDRSYQNATPRAMLLYGLKKVQLQERETLLTQGSIGRLRDDIESECKCRNSQITEISVEKTLAF